MLKRVPSSLVPELSLDELARLHVVRGARLMWLIGAGASAAAGVPTAGQMIDEFRQLIYSTVHGVPLAALSLAEPAIRDRIERFFAGHPDYPDPGDPGEYSALFEAAWTEPGDRRAYLEGKLVVGKPAFGNFGLAVLAALGRAPVVWTPNFDRVYERAAELVLEPPAHLTVATLDTSKIAAAALAADRFPLYVKLHGDYQSDQLKNTAEELREQDAVHRTALVQATQRYGLIVAGYSGRDASLMAALTGGADGATPFPAGLFWCRRPGEDPLPGGGQAAGDGAGPWRRCPVGDRAHLRRADRAAPADLRHPAADAGPARPGPPAQTPRAIHHPGPARGVAGGPAELPAPGPVPAHLPAGGLRH